MGDQPIEPVQIGKGCQIDSLARPVFDKPTKPFPNLARLRCDVIKRFWRTVRKQRKCRLPRDQAGLFKPVEQALAVPNPFNLLPPGRGHAVQKIKPRVIGDERWWRRGVGCHLKDLCEFGRRLGAR